MAPRTDARGTACNAAFLFRILEESVNRYGTRSTHAHALAAADEIALPSVGKCPTHSHTHTVRKQFVENHNASFFLEAEAFA